MEKLTKGPYYEDMYRYFTQCTICLEYYKNTEEITYLPCDPRHNFHTECLNTWLYNCLKCPICNTKLTLEATKKCKKFADIINFIKQEDEKNNLSSRKTSAI